MSGTKVSGGCFPFPWLEKELSWLIFRPFCSNFHFSVVPPSMFSCDCDAPPVCYSAPCYQEDANLCQVSFFFFRATHCMLRLESMENRLLAIIVKLLLLVSPLITGLSAGVTNACTYPTVILNLLGAKVNFTKSKIFFLQSTAPFMNRTASFV